MPRPRKRPIAIEEEEEEEDEERSEEEAPRGTQRRRIQVPTGNESEEEESDLDNARSAGQEEFGENGNENGRNQFVTKLVRYALACEYARLPIRREGIKDNVFGKHKVPFRQIFDGAQEQFRTKFGMEMIELPSREKTTKKARIAASKAVQLVSSKTYMLTSTLPSQYRIPTILPPSLIPDLSTEAAYTALYTVIISLISLFGQEGRLSEAKLDNYLHRMNADVNMPMDKTDIVLQKMIKQGYLVKLKENVNGDETVDWMVGPRGKVEVGNNGIKGLVEEVYGDDAPDDLAERIRSSLGLKRSIEGREEEEALSEGVQDRSGASRRSRRSARQRNEDD